MTAEEYRAKSAELFEEWKKKHNALKFVTDGIVDPETWFDQNERILFVLKEAYSKDDMVWDLPKWIIRNPSERCANNCCKKCENCKLIGTTYNHVAEWIYVIEKLSDKNEDYYDNWLGNKEHKDYDKTRVDFLKKSAIINLKKSNGKEQSETDDLYYYTSWDKDLLKRQIELLSPTIIICGGTYNYLRCIYLELEKLEDSSNGCTKLNGIKIIAMPHPNSRKSSKEKADILAELFKKTL